MASLDPNSNFVQQLDVVSLAASKLFDNDQIGKLVHEIIERDYETADEILADLQEIDDSDILEMLFRDPQYTLNEEEDKPLIYELLHRIFKDNISSLDMLQQNISLPNTLSECNKDHIQYIASHIAETINKTSKKEIKSSQLTKFITKTKRISGKYIHDPDTTALDFIDEARKYRIPAGKSRQLFIGIKQYQFETDNTLKRFVNGRNISFCQQNNGNNNHLIEEEEKKAKQEETNTVAIVPIPPFNNRHNKHLIQEEEKKTEQEVTNAQQPAINMKKDETSSSNGTTKTSVSSLADCAPKHIIFIIDKHILDTIKKTKKGPDIKQYREKIIECIEKNEISGAKLQSESFERKAFAKLITTHCDNVKLGGQCLKLHKLIMAFDVQSIEFDIESNTKPDASVIKEVKEQGQKPAPVHNLRLNIDDLDDNKETSYCLQEIQNCNVNEFAYLLEDYIIDALKEEKLTPHKTQIATYFKHNKIDGQHALQMERKVFVKTLANHCDNTKIKGSLGQLHNALNGTNKKVKLDISTVLIPSTFRKATSSQNRKLLVVESKLNLEQCDCEHIIYVLVNHILPEFGLCELTENKDNIIEYIQTNNLNGKQIKAMSEDAFAGNLSIHCDDQSLEMQSKKLYKHIIGFNYHIVPRSISPRKLPIPTSINVCSANQLIFVMNRSMIPELPKLMPYKAIINEYFAKNNIDGNAFLNLNHKTFVKDLIAETNDKGIRGVAGKLHKQIKEYKFGVTLPETPNCGDYNPNYPNVPLKVVLPAVNETDETEVKGEPERVLLFNANSVPTPQILESETSALNTPTLTVVPSDFDIDCTLYGDICCETLANLAKYHGNTKMSMTHIKIQKIMSKNKVDGKMFMDIFDVNDGYEFITFFNQKICGAPVTAKGNKKFVRFRKWFINEIQAMNENDEQIREYDIAEMIKFILDGYDEYIANIFKLEKIDGKIWNETDYINIGNQINAKYAVPKGDIRKLCEYLDGRLKMEVVQIQKNKEQQEEEDRKRKEAKKRSTPRSKKRQTPKLKNKSTPIPQKRKLKKWTSRKSTRVLPQIKFFQSLANVEDEYDDNKFDEDDEYDLLPVDVLQQMIDKWNEETAANQHIDKRKTVKYIKTQNLTRDKLAAMKKDRWAKIMSGNAMDGKVAMALFKRLKILLYEWTRNISTMKECDNDELLYVLMKYILPIKNVNTDKLIKQIKDKQLTGAMTDAQFQDALKNVCGEKEIKRIYKTLSGFRWHEVLMGTLEFSESTAYDV